MPQETQPQETQLQETQEKSNQKSKHKKLIIAICIVLTLSAIASIILWTTHIRHLRAEMNSLAETATINFEDGFYGKALESAEEAMDLAQRLRDDEATELLETFIILTKAVIYGYARLHEENYQAALTQFTKAKEYALNIPDLNAERIDEKIALTETYIAFYTLIENAQAKTAETDYDSALTLYNEAHLVASALSFSKGINLTLEGIAEVEALIIEAKRSEAINLYFEGSVLHIAGQYEESLEYFYKALEIFSEIEDTHNIEMTQARIEQIKQRQAEAEMQSADAESQQQTQPDPTTDDTDTDSQESTDSQDTQSESTSNYEHNISINFDLQTLIDNQNQRPANQIRMGSTEGMNEGWYNGCGWVATYNALILLENPRHPAEIVRHFETSGGTVLGGVFGTYPNAIDAYLRDLGYTVNHTLFPQLTMNIDDAIKESRVAIIAYAHTNAAHYATIEYREDIDMFVVYNDNFARIRSTNLGLQNTTSAGAAIDSVVSLMNNTRNILFSFSLITIG